MRVCMVSQVPAWGKCIQSAITLLVLKRLRFQTHGKKLQGWTLVVVFIQRHVCGLPFRRTTRFMCMTVSRVQDWLILKSHQRFWRGEKIFRLRSRMTLCATQVSAQSAMKRNPKAGHTRKCMNALELNSLRIARRMKTNLFALKAV